MEWARDGITVNAIAPGPVPTEGVLKAFTAPDQDTPDVFAMKAKAKEIPLGRWGEPEDIGQMAVYLASPAGDWITGSIFVVDGGTEAWVAEGLPVVRGKKAVSLERQVRIAAGSLVLLGSLLAYFVNPYIIALPAFVGAGLIVLALVGRKMGR